MGSSTCVLVQFPAEQAAVIGEVFASSWRKVPADAQPPMMRAVLVAYEQKQADEKLAATKKADVEKADALKQVAAEPVPAQPTTALGRGPAGNDDKPAALLSDLSYGGGEFMEGDVCGGGEEEERSLRQPQMPHCDFVEDSSQSRDARRA